MSIYTRFSGFLKPDRMAVFIAAMALVASQFPPVHTLFQAPAPVVRMGNAAGITHRLGVVQVLVPITLSNTGTRPFSIDRIECSFTKGDPAFDITVRSTYETVVPDVKGRTVFLSHIEIFPGQSYYMQALCSPEPSDHWLSEQAILAELLAHFHHTTVVINRCVDRNSCPQEIPEEISSRMLALFKENFDLETGDYTLSLRTTTRDGDELLAVASLELQTFHLASLRRYADFYRFGGGNSVGADISPEPIPVLIQADDGT